MTSLWRKQQRLEINSFLQSNGGANGNNNPIAALERPTDPIANQSLITCMFNFSHNPQFFGTCEEDCVPGTWAGSIVDPDGTYSKHRGEVILEPILPNYSNSAAYARGMNGGQSWRTGITSVANLKKGIQYRVGGLVANPSIEHGKPSGVAGGELHIGTGTEQGTQNVFVSGPEDIPVGYHMFVSKKPYTIYSAVNKTYQPHFRHLNEQANTQRMIPQVLPLRTTSLNEILATIYFETLGQLDQFMENINPDSISSSELPDWCSIFDSKYHYGMIDSVYWMSRIHGSFAMYEHLFHICHSDSDYESHQTDWDDITKEAFDKFLDECKEFWQFYRETTSNPDIIYNCQEGNRILSYPYQIIEESNMEYNPNDNQQFLEMSNLKKATDIPLFDSTRREFNTMYLGQAISTGHSGQYVSAWIKNICIG